MPVVKEVVRVASEETNRNFTKLHELFPGAESGVSWSAFIVVVLEQNQEQQKQACVLVSEGIEGLVPYLKGRAACTFLNYVLIVSACIPIVYEMWMAKMGRYIQILTAEVDKRKQ